MTKNRIVVMAACVTILLAAGMVAVYAELAVKPGVTINEIMYNPPWNDQYEMTDAKYEWIELFNSSTAAIDMSGWRVTVDANYEYVVPANTTIAAGGYVILASDVRAFNGGLPYGWTVSCPVIGKTGNDTAVLGNTGATIRVYDAAGTMVDEVAYTDRAPWPASGLDDGRTLELLSPQADNSEAGAWSASAISAPLGTPGKPNSILSGSELWQGAATANPSSVDALTRVAQQTFIIRNDDERDMEGVTLTLPTDWQWSGKAANVTVTSAAGEVTVTGNGRAGKPYVISVTGIELATGAQLELTLARVTSSPLADTANEFCVSATDGDQWYPLKNTPSITVNAATQRADHIVINEVYCNGGDSMSADFCDWFELYNPTDEALCIDGWYVLDALPEHVLATNHTNEGAMRLPNPTGNPDYVIQPGGYMLIALDQQYYEKEFPNGPKPALEENMDNCVRTTAGDRVIDASKDGSAPNCTRIADFGLNKNRDELVLYDGENVIDAVAWGNGNSFNMLTSRGQTCRHGLSLVRAKDGYEAKETGGEYTELVGNSFRANVTPTPGTTNR